MISQHIHNNTLKIIVQANARAEGVLGYDTGKQALRIAVKAKAEQNKANVAVIGLFKRQGYTVRILRGLSSREKVVRVL
ncbi:DUF167 domain-containing protein [Candidatus Woesearchaeota archaeon]|nr:DUF167 domain-containing protein [Candidatus Woesearchaeota archaeon]